MKLTKAQTAALLSATFNPSARGDGMGAYVVMTCHGRTRKSLHDMGLMTGHYYLTRKGVETLAEMAGNEVDMYGYAWEGDIIIRAVPTVEIQGDDPSLWAPDFSADGARECYFGCGVTPVAVFVDYVGRTEGLCGSHRDRVEGQTYDIPATAHTDAESLSVDDLTPNGRVTYAYYANNGMDDATALRKAADMCGTITKDAESVCTATDDNPDCLHCERVAMDAVDMRESVQELMNAQRETESMTIQTVNVVQAHMGMNGMNHYHAPGCRDIERESKRWGIRAEHGNMGRYEFSFSSVADIIEHEYSDCNNGDAYDMVSHANDTFDGLKIMSCLRDSLPLGNIQGHPLTRSGERWMLAEIPLDSERCTVCEVFGNVADNSTDIDGKHVCGYCVDNGRSSATLESHDLTFYVETEGAGTKYSCANCGSIDTRARFAEYVCESDAGFVETEGPWIDPECGCERFANPSEVPCPDHTPKSLSNGYSAVAALSTGAGFHTVADSESATPAAPVATGTTHHTMDENGAQWERFDHVLSVCDVVKVVGRQGVYEVHCLIPGLPVVYVLGTTGEPFPVPATDVYAL